MNLREFVVRVVLSAGFSALGVVVTFGEFGQTPMTGWAMFVSLIVVSIIWQYYALSPILGMTEMKWRSIVRIMWIITVKETFKRLIS